MVPATDCRPSTLNHTTEWDWDPRYEKLAYRINDEHSRAALPNDDNSKQPNLIANQNDKQNNPQVDTSAHYEATNKKSIK